MINLGTVSLSSDYINTTHHKHVLLKIKCSSYNSSKLVKTSWKNKFCYLTQNVVRHLNDLWPLVEHNFHTSTSFTRKEFLNLKPVSAAAASLIKVMLPDYSDSPSNTSMKRTDTWVLSRRILFSSHCSVYSLASKGSNSSSAQFLKVPSLVRVLLRAANNQERNP